MKSKKDEARGIRTSVITGSGETVRQPLSKYPPDKTLAIPIREVSQMESITTGFRTDFFSINEKHDGVTSGAGCGSLYLNLQFEGRLAAINVAELFAAWIETFDVDKAKEVRAAMGECIYQPKENPQ